MCESRRVGAGGATPRAPMEEWAFGLSERGNKLAE
jgi:hypothetical protein